MKISKSPLLQINCYIIFILFFAFPFTAGFCQTVIENDLLSSQNRLKFGNSLYENKDYLRAAGEFKEYLKGNNNDTVQFKFANCFFRLNRFTEAGDNFKGLFFSPTISEEAKLMFYEASFFQNDYKIFRGLVKLADYYPLRYGTVIERLDAATYFLGNESLPDETTLLKSFPDSNRTQLSLFYQLKKNPNYKNPTTAALLSAIIPGAGKIYTEEISDGITAFLSTAISVYLAYSSFKGDHQFRGWLFTGLAGFFYGGSIYGSAASAQVYNARFRLNLDAEIKLYFEQRDFFLPKIDF